MSNTDEFETIKDVHDVDIKVVAYMLGCTSRSIRTWIVDNDMPHTKVNGRLHFDLSVVVQWSIIRELKKKGLWKPIPPATQPCEIRGFLKEHGYALRLARIEYDKNGKEVTA